MRYTAFLLLVLQVWQLPAQDACIDGRYTTPPLFSDAEILVNSDLVYGTDLDLNGTMQELLLDIYRPSEDIDTLPRRPLVLLVHGGGLQGGAKDGPLPVFLCNELAKRGYVAASIDYRIGWIQLDNCGGDTASLSRARYRAQQDLHAAIRYLQEKADDYGIDTNHIFLAGSSVGATMALQAAFSVEEDFDPALVEELGALDSSANPFVDHSRNISGVFGTGVGTDKPWMLNRSDIPVLFFHGTCDFTVPYREAPLFYCYAPVCFSTFYGSRYLADQMRESGHPYWIYTNERGGHEAVDSATILDQAVPFLRSILCGTITSKEIYEYHVDGCIVSHLDTIQLDIHPNPVQDDLSVTIRSGATGTAMIEVFNAAGQQVYIREEEFFAPVKEVVLSLPVSMAARGIYIVRVRIQASVGQETFMKW